MSRSKFEVWIDDVPRGDLQHSGGQWRWTQHGRSSVIFDRQLDRQEAVRQIAKTCRVHVDAVKVRRITA